MGIGLRDIIKDDRDDLVRDKQKRTMRMLLFTVAILAVLIVVVIVMIILNNAKKARLERIKTISIDMGNISKIVKTKGEEYVANRYTGTLIGIPLDEEPREINVDGSKVEYRYDYYYLDSEQLNQITTALNNPKESYFVNYMTGDVVNINGVVANNGKKYYSIEDITAIADESKIPDIRYISDVEDLRLMAQYPNGIFRLSNNIDMATYATGEGWTPVANFGGTFDGRGYTITNLNINRATTTYCGLFANVTSTGVIKNIKIVEPSVNGGDYTGILAGTCSGNISNISITGGQLNSARQYVGALVGAFDQGKISNCLVENVIINANGTVGGLVGTMYNGVIEKSGAKVKITAVESVGGLIGSIVANNDTTIDQDYADADIIGQRNVGGLIGTLQITSRNTMKLADCYSQGIIDNGGDGKGGSIGYLYAANSPDVYIQSVYTATVVPTDATARGGFIGRTNIQTGTNTVTTPKSYFEIERYLDPDITDVGSETGYSIDFDAKSPSEMKVSSTYTDWNFKEIWTIDEYASRPTLRWQREVVEEKK